MIFRIIKLWLRSITYFKKFKVRSSKFERHYSKYLIDYLLIELLTGFWLEKRKVFESWLLFNICLFFHPKQSDWFKNRKKSELIFRETIPKFDSSLIISTQRVISNWIEKKPWPFCEQLKCLNKFWWIFFSKLDSNIKLSDWSKYLSSLGV